MEKILITKEEVIEDSEITVWFIEKDNGAILININKILNETITDCDWIGKEKKFLSVEYISLSCQIVAASTKHEKKTINITK